MYKQNDNNLNIYVDIMLINNYYTVIYYTMVTVNISSVVMGYLFIVSSDEMQIQQKDCNKILHVLIKYKRFNIFHKLFCNSKSKENKKKHI